MNVDDLSSKTGEWLRGEGQLADVVVSSRVRLARNLAEYPFLSKASPSERTEIYRTITEEIAAASVIDDELLVDIEDADPIDRQFLVERNLISRNHAGGEGSRGVGISRAETRSLMINEEDHLRIQGLRSGLDLDSLWQEINDIDDRLAERLAFAFDNTLGYLTACPTNVGTGIRVSVMVHLPALKWTKDIERVERAAQDMRLAVRGLHGEGTEAAGDLYQISNQTTLGQSEEDIIRAFRDSIIPRIAEYERAARDALARHGESQLDDRIWRAYGILKNARCISTEETQTLLSPIRMGIHLGRFQEFDINTLNEIFLFAQSAHLQKMHQQSMSGEQRAVARADYIRSRLAE